MDDTDSGLTELIAAARAAPGSAALVRALLAEAGRAQQPAEALNYLAEIDPTPFDRDCRASVAAFLAEGGRDEAARRWGPLTQLSTHGTGEGAEVIDLGARRERGASFAPPVETARTTFADVGGLEDVKQQIRRRIIAPLERPGLFNAFNRRSGGGILLYGPPGCGKTMIAKATAGEARVAFLPIRIPDILDMYIGESEKRLAAAFSEARARRPAILFFDEMEALAARRRYGDHDHKSSLVSTFLSEFDGLSASGEGLLVLAATNVPWMIDSAFRRPGRFDRVLFVPPPDRPARLHILRGLIAGQPTAPGLDMDRYAASTSGFSGADLLNLVETAIDLAIDDSLDSDQPAPISRKHLDAAMAEVKPTTAEWLSTARNYAKYANDGGLYDDVLVFLDKNTR